MEKEIAKVHRRLRRSKLAIYVIIAFVALLTYLLIVVSQEINQQAVIYQPKAATVDYYRRNPRFNPTNPTIKPTEPTVTPTSFPATPPKECSGNLLKGPPELGSDLIRCTDGREYNIPSGSGADEEYAKEVCCNYESVTDTGFKCKFWQYYSPSLSKPSIESAVNQACSLLCTIKGGGNCNQYPRGDGGYYYCDSPVCPSAEEVDNMCKTYPDAPSCDSNIKCRAYYFCASQCRTRLVQGCMVCPQIYQCPW
ncbi:hypothetical protein A3H80_00900 [Candidatus Roizmanbacteria bacterium RIFCSPLOWO2_02_FULL_37_19]|nr:MAG: hypothetical protein A2862_01950 [Candidatus Roizmanbacteria bacterium RIFCSPHIGHO2_01_FULL_38_41]OGK32543.1 MAG: hypothetical protein A3E10_00770 [Candidatus Roizmanbacteria bacterium RIFCSPHIGHO2_12_FULL_37_23]OGK44224.1 MAG: hypothetical protein A2956_00020 [Candidatus Roizmanbacteria bacterium RIFCSPLOWO2_01_FULL_37_57]OGK54523.1 MAG: hypothetical protein A3H80_00900 [Candidatus Roizmanbacteria bacterium RIFCSPLOWO2_02_FULL_37_19]